MYTKICVLALVAATLAVCAGCELTASAFVQQEFNTDPRVFTKPNGLARVEIKAVKVVGWDAKMQALNKAKESAKDEPKRP